MGLTWDHLYSVIQQRLGAGNLAALQAVSPWFDGLDSSQPASIANFFNNLQTQLNAAGAGDGSLSLSSLWSEVQNAVTTKVGEALVEITPQLIAKFVPYIGGISSLLFTSHPVARKAHGLR